MIENSKWWWFTLFTILFNGLIIAYLKSTKGDPDFLFTILTVEFIGGCLAALFNRSIARISMGIATGAGATFVILLGYLLFFSGIQC